MEKGHIKYTLIPRSVVYISTRGGSGSIAVPVLEYKLTQDNTDNADTLVFTCTTEQFPTELETELLIADGRSGLYTVEVYTDYMEDGKTFIKRDGKYEYDPEFLSKIKKEDNLRFFGLMDSPSVEKGLSKGNIYTFTAYDVSYYLRTNNIVRVFKDMSCYEVLQMIVSETGLVNNVSISPRVDKNVKLGQKGAKDGYVYVARNIPYWKVVRDCAIRMGEDIRIKKRQLQIGRFTPEVNRFEYIYGSVNLHIPSSEKQELSYSPNVDELKLKKQPRMEDEDIVVKVINYDRQNNEIGIGVAAQYQSELYNELAKSGDSSSASTSDEGLKYINTKIFRFFFYDREGDLDQLAKDLLSNIIYKRWNMSFKSLGNPKIEVDDIINIQNYFESENFKLIKWRTSRIQEQYDVSGGYDCIIECDGVLLDNIEELNNEKKHKRPSSDTQFSQSSTGSSTSTTTGTRKYARVSVNEKDYYKDPTQSSIGNSGSNFNKWDGKYVITSNYGYRTHPIFGTRKFHSGIDYALSLGTPVNVPFDGTVIETGWDGGFGNSVLVKHPDGYFTKYAHLSEINVKKGEVITKNTTIGKAGSTGYSTGSHLHFSVLDRNHGYINPTTYLGPQQ